MQPPSSTIASRSVRTVFPRDYHLSRRVLPHKPMWVTSIPTPQQQARTPQQSTPLSRGCHAFPEGSFHLSPCGSQAFQPPSSKLKPLSLNTMIPRGCHAFPKGSFHMSSCWSQASQHPSSKLAPLSSSTLISKGCHALPGSFHMSPCGSRAFQPPSSKLAPLSLSTLACAAPAVPCPPALARFQSCSRATQTPHSPSSQAPCLQPSEPVLPSCP